MTARGFDLLHTNEQEQEKDWFVRLSRAFFFKCPRRSRPIRMQPKWIFSPNIYFTTERPGSKLRPVEVRSGEFM